MSSRTLAVVALLLGSVPLFASTASAARPAKDVRGGERIVAGWGFVAHDARVRGAHVTVTTLRGRNLLARGARPRTTRFGTFDAKLRRPVPQFFVVRLHGGRVDRRPLRGTLRAIVRRPTDGMRLVHVSPASTLVAARYAQRPRAGLERAARDVRRLLRLPRDHDLAASLRRGDVGFDGARFLTAARRNGGLDRYVHRLATRAGGKRTIAFRPVRRRPAPAQARAASGSGGIADTVITALIDGVVEGPEEDALDWVLSGIGFGDSGDGEALAQISDQLGTLLQTTQQIEQQVTQLQTQVAQLAAELTRGEYSTLVSSFPSSWVGSEDDEILTDLSWLVEHAAGDCGAGRLAGCVGSLPAGADPAGWCASAAEKDNAFEVTACDALLQIAAQNVGETLPKAADDIGGTAGADGLLVVYQQSKTASLAAANGFATEDYYNEASQIYQHYAAIEALLANYLTQYWVAEGNPRDLLAQKLRPVQANIDAQATLLPSELPVGTAVQAANGRMWGLAKGPGLPPGQAGVGECVQQYAPWMWWWYAKNPSSACTFYYDTAMKSTAGMDGWTVPSASDLDGISSGPLTNDVLVDQMGLPDISADARAAVIPPPNPGVLAPGVDTGGPYYGNPGTALALMTSECTDGVVWNSGLSQSGPGYDSPVFAKIRECKYVDLSNGKTRTQCVSGDDGYYGCDMPVSTTYSNRIGKGSGQLDYGHPTAVLLWRTPDATETWIKR